MAQTSVFIKRAGKSERGSLQLTRRSPITIANQALPLCLSFAQQRLWFLAQMEGASRAYHISFGCRLRGSLDKAALRRTLDQIVRRHEALRTVFVQVEGVPSQRIAPAEQSRFVLL